MLHVLFPWRPLGVHWIRAGFYDTYAQILPAVRGEYTIVFGLKRIRETKEGVEGPLEKVKQYADACLLGNGYYLLD